jgi:hypothetical protein
LELEDTLPEREPNLNIEGYTEEQVRYHLYLLYDAGLVHGRVESAAIDRYPRIRVVCLTWHGHEFADNARNDQTWKKAIQVVGEKLGSASFEAVSSLLAQLVKQALGVGG